VVVGGDVVVVVGGDVVVVEGDDPTEGGEVDGVVVDVVGEEVDGVVVNEVGLAVLAPGCSLATITPMSAVAPVAARMDARVRRRNRALARCLVSGECCHLARLTCSGAFRSAPFHKSRPGFRPTQWPLWTVCEMIDRAASSTTGEKQQRLGTPTDLIK
jgi:hypothetical protein